MRAIVLLDSACVCDVEINTLKATSRTALQFCEPEPQGSFQIRRLNFAQKHKIDQRRLLIIEIVLCT